jgi:DNA-binding MarR family transcriptional regulator
LNCQIWVNELKNISQIAISQASITVHELYDLGLISCKNPNDKIGKLFEITDKGMEILKCVIGS